MGNFYDAIEPAVRPLVKLLRDSGFNTTCSCGHVRYIEMECYHEGDVERLVDALIEAGHTNFWASMRHAYIGGQHYRSLRVDFGREIEDYFVDSEQQVKGIEYGRVQELREARDG